MYFPLTTPAVSGITENNRWQGQHRFYAVALRRFEPKGSGLWWWHLSWKIVLHLNNAHYCAVNNFITWCPF